MYPKKANLEIYEAISAQYQIPIVATGFEPLDILQGLYYCIRQLENGQAKVENQYIRSVRQTGNESAQALLQTVFDIGPQIWRGIGKIPASGFRLKPQFDSSQFKWPRIKSIL